MELQVGSSHYIHSLLWILNGPVLCNTNIDITFVNSVVKTYVVDPNENPKLFKLVTAFQVHSHSKSCRYYKNEKCRYNFFTDHAIASFPIQDDLSKEVKRDILNKRERVSSKVKEYIYNNLHLRKRNIFNPMKKILRKSDK